MVRNTTLSESIQMKDAKMVPAPPQQLAPANGASLQFYESQVPSNRYVTTTDVRYGLWSYLAGWLNSGCWLSSDAGSEGWLTIPSDDISTNATRLNNKTTFKSIGAELLGTSLNLNDTFARAAIAMTQSIRSNANGAPKAGGLMGVQVTMVQVHWAWISLPLLITLGGMAYLLVTVVATAKSKAPLWKEEALAMVMHGFLSEADAKTAATFTTCSGMDQYAETTKANLRHLADGATGLLATAHSKSRQDGSKPQLLSAYRSQRVLQDRSGATKGGSETSSISRASTF